MTDDLYYVPGDFYRMCERTGFKVRASKTRKEWNGRIVRRASFEMRQPQDFVRGVRDDQFVPEPRPRQVDAFLGPLQTTIAANAAAGASSLTLDSSVRMAVNDKLSVILDDGSSFSTVIQTVPTQTSVTILPTIPFKTSVGNFVTDISAVATASIG